MKNWENIRFLLEPRRKLQVEDVKSLVYQMLSVRDNVEVV